MTECYRCGQEGHTRAHCPDQAPLPPAAPAPGGTAERRLRIVPDPAIARTWAQVIRERLGWPREGDTRD